MLKSQGKTTAGNTTVGNNNLTNQTRGKKHDRSNNPADNYDDDDDDDDDVIEVFEDHDSVFVNGTFSSESKKERRLRMSASLPETEIRNDAVNDMSNPHSVMTVKARRRSASSVSDEKQSGDKWSRPKSTTSSTQGSDYSTKGMLYIGKQSATSSMTNSISG